MNGTAAETERKRRFVIPDTVTLPLSDGDWIEIKTELTYGEQEELNAAGLRSAHTEDGGGMAIDLQMAEFNVKRILTWVVDWSFRGKPSPEYPHGQTVEVSARSIRALTVDTATEVLAALDAYKVEWDAKKGLTPTPSSEIETTS